MNTKKIFIPILAVLVVQVAVAGESGRPLPRDLIQKLAEMSDKILRQKLAVLSKSSKAAVGAAQKNVPLQKSAKFSCPKPSEINVALAGKELQNNVSFKLNEMDWTAYSSMTRAKPTPLKIMRTMFAHEAGIMCVYGDGGDASPLDIAVTRLWKPSPSTGELTFAAKSCKLILDSVPGPERPKVSGLSFAEEKDGYDRPAFRLMIPQNNRVGLPEGLQVICER